MSSNRMNSNKHCISIGELLPAYSASAEPPSGARVRSGHWGAGSSNIQVRIELKINEDLCNSQRCIFFRLIFESRRGGGIEK